MSNLWLMQFLNVIRSQENHHEFRFIIEQSSPSTRTTQFSCTALSTLNLKEQLGGKLHFASASSHLRQSCISKSLTSLPAYNPQTQAKQAHHLPILIVTTSINFSKPLSLFKIMPFPSIMIIK